jgi:hypothetical protein
MLSEVCVAERPLARQFSFRLPDGLVERVEACAETIRARGLDATRADVVRLLLAHALDSTGCQIERLFKGCRPTTSCRRGLGATPRCRPASVTLPSGAPAGPRRASLRKAGGATHGANAGPSECTRPMAPFATFC